MLKAKFRKKWVYGNPDSIKIQSRDWLRWIRFVNIVVDDHTPGVIIQTKWDDKNNLYGYSQVEVDDADKPSEYSGQRRVNVKGVKEAMELAEAEDWSIETHPYIFPMAMRVIKWIELMESRQRAKEDAIRQALAK